MFLSKRSPSHTKKQKKTNKFLQPRLFFSVERINKRAKMLLKYSLKKVRGSFKKKKACLVRVQR